MPFDEASAAAAGKKGGKNRWMGKAPESVRNKQLKISVTESERNDIAEKATAAALSMSELIVRAVERYDV